MCLKDRFAAACTYVHVYWIYMDILYHLVCLCECICVSVTVGLLELYIGLMLALVRDLYHKTHKGSPCVHNHCLR